MNRLSLPSRDVQHFRGNDRIKTLSFREGSTHNQITYQTSRNPLVGQLTALFQNISATLEFGRRLILLYQTGSLKISAELKRMQHTARKHRLLEKQAVVPVLQTIASDAHVSQSNRNRAEAILNGKS